MEDVSDLRSNRNGAAAPSVAAPSAAAEEQAAPEEAAPKEKEEAKEAAPARSEKEGEDLGETRDLGWLSRLMGPPGASANGSSIGGFSGEDDDDTLDQETLLEAVLEDGVVRELIQSGDVTAAQVHAALREKKRPEQRLWRAVATLEEAHREVLFRTAARQADVAMIENVPEQAARAALATVPAPYAGALLETGFLPVDPGALEEAAGEATEEAAGPARLLLVTHDPTSPVARDHAQSLDRPVGLRYAPEEHVRARIDALADLSKERALDFDTDEQPGPGFDLDALDLDEHEAGANGALTEDLRDDVAEEGAFSTDGHTHEPIPNLSADWMSKAFEGTAASAGEEASEQLAPEDAALEEPSSSEESEEEAPRDADADDSEKGSVEDLDTNDRVVAFLMRSSIVEVEQVAEAKQRRRDQTSDEALWRVLAQGEGVDRAAVYAEAARVYAFPLADLDEHTPDPEFTRSVARHFPDELRDELFELGVVPFRIEAERGNAKLYLLTHDPMRPAVHRVTDRLDVDRLELQYAPEKAVRGLISDAFPRTNEYLKRIEDEDRGMDLGASYEDDEDLIDEEALEAEISRSKLINLFEATLVEAVHEGASDIHIFPNANREVEIHFRVDGRLKEWHVERKVHPEALLAVIKDNSMNVDRFEKDTAQDGFIQRRVDGTLIRFRVSVMPIANADQDTRAESIVIRVLDDRKVIKDLSKLGLLEGALEKFRHAINQPHGMVIMTGPTGSGKSTTLVAALHEVVSPEVNVLTIEDPVEYVIQDVRQIKLSHKLQLEDALRSLLRHDPDVVMVGEMRDRITAELAIKLANTGHLTFSTLHTNDAPSAINRLYKMGIEPFLIAYAINLVVAQRLIRKLCPACKTLDENPDPVMLEGLGFSEEEIETVDFYRKGHDDHCSTCNGFGFKGRRAISEALHFSRAIRHMIVDAGKTVDEEAIREKAQEEGMFTLQGSARQVVKKGETSVREMMRVVTTEIG